MCTSFGNSFFDNFDGILLLKGELSPQVRKTRVASA